MSAASRHIPFDHLVDLVEGRLPATEQAPVRMHLAACPRCVADVAWLVRVIGIMRADASEDVPPATSARAVRLFSARQPPPVLPHRARRVLAVLRFDSAHLPLAPSVRAAPATGRQLLFRAGEHDLDLRLTPTGSRWVVAGQVLGSGEGGHVELHGPTGMAEAELNDLREFTLSPVPPGGYALWLRLPDVEIEVPALELGEQGA